MTDIFVDAMDNQGRETRLNKLTICSVTWDRTYQFWESVSGDNFEGSFIVQFVGGGMAWLQTNPLDPNDSRRPVRVEPLGG